MNIGVQLHIPLHIAYYVQVVVAALIPVFRHIRLREVQRTRECVKPVVHIHLLALGIYPESRFYIALFYLEHTGLGIYHAHKLFWRFGQFLRIIENHFGRMGYGIIHHISIAICFLDGFIEPIAVYVKTIFARRNKLLYAVRAQSLTLENKRQIGVVGTQHYGIVVEGIPVVERDCRDA